MREKQVKEARKSGNYGIIFNILKSSRKANSKFKFMLYFLLVMNSIFFRKIWFCFVFGNSNNTANIEFV